MAAIWQQNIRLAEKEMFWNVNQFVLRKSSGLAVASPSLSQEDAVEIYTGAHAASATATSAVTVVAATISESRGAFTRMPLCSSRFSVVMLRTMFFPPLCFVLLVV